jgi:hypothetical protein
MTQKDDLTVTRHITAGSFAPVSRKYPLTKAEQRSEIQARAQARSMGHQRDKAILGHIAIADMNLSSMGTFSSTAEQLHRIKTAGNRPQELQESIDLFYKHTVEETGGQLAECTAIGASHVTRILEQKTDEKISWRERLFGKLRDE